MTMVTDEILGRLARQQHDLFRRVREGTLDAGQVSGALQAIIEGKSPVTVSESPVWWRSPEVQLHKARWFWPGVTLPEAPKEFVPQTKTEVLLLHVPDAFGRLWNLVDPPPGYVKYRWKEVKSGQNTLRLAPNKREYEKPVWLAFDPEYGEGIHPALLWGQPHLAASEVLSALIQFPSWPLTWLNGASVPIMSGYQLKGEVTPWSAVPFVVRLDEERKLELNAMWAGQGYENYASPSVREC